MIPALVVPLSALLEKQKYTEEVFLEPLGLALARGSLTEIIGPVSSGKSSLVLSVLAHLTQTGEICAMVDACNGFNPSAAASIGVCLENLLWSKGDGSIVSVVGQPIDYDRPARMIADETIAECATRAADDTRI